MITQDTIDRLNDINNLRLFFNTTTTTIGTLPAALSNAQTYMDLVIKELSLDVLKRDGQ